MVGGADAARAAYQHAIDSGEPEHAPRAWVNLGNLEKMVGNADAARTAYQHTIDSGHPEALSLARNALRLLE